MSKRISNHNIDDYPENLNICDVTAAWKACLSAGWLYTSLCNVWGRCPEIYASVRVKYQINF